MSALDRRVTAPFRRGPIRPPMPSGIDPAALITVHEATRAILTCAAPKQIVDLLVDLVHDLGGNVAEADLNPVGALPIDIGLGVVPPLLPVTSGVSIARLHLEMLLPSVVEDARAAVLRLLNTDRLNGEASVDVLTGLLTRRALFRELSRLTGGDVVALFDLDHFKQLNDTNGHAAGDEALAAFGAMLRESVRPGDLVGRYGGEEFIVGLSHADAARATARVSAMRARWLATSPPVTFSAGVAVVLNGDPRAAVLAADHAMYRAKQAGRDRCEMATDDDY